MGNEAIKVLCRSQFVVKEKGQNAFAFWPLLIDFGLI